MTVLDRPEPPRNIHGSEFAGEALTLNWSAPFEDGGAPITNYVIERFVNNHITCTVKMEEGFIQKRVLLGLKHQRKCTA